MFKATAKLYDNLLIVLAAVFQCCSDTLSMGA